MLSDSGKVNGGIDWSELADKAAQPILHHPGKENRRILLSEAAERSRTPEKVLAKRFKVVALKTVHGTVKLIKREDFEAWLEKRKCR